MYCMYDVSRKVSHTGEGFYLGSGMWIQGQTIMKFILQLVSAFHYYDSSKVFQANCMYVVAV
jgi:hypothetical protein